MNIELQKLEFSNMFSYGEDNVIDLNKERITQLSAVNGSGKTSIALVLQELLFSKNVKGIKKTDILNRHSTSKSWNGTVYFKVANKDYSVSVKRTGASTKVTLLEDDVDISEHKVIDTYKKINSLLGSDFNVFTQLTYQSSTDLLEFLKATDANRKKFLINLFNLEKYLAVGDKIKVASSSTDKELSALKTEINTVTSFLDSTKIPEKLELVNIPDVDDQLAVRISEIDNELKNYNNTCKLIDKNNMYKKERDSLQFDVSLKEPEPFEFMEQHKALIHDIGVLNSNIATTKQELANINTDDKCPSCGQTLDNFSQLAIKQSKEKLLEELTEKKNKGLEQETIWSVKLKEHEKTRQNWIKNSESLKQFEQLTQLIDSDMDTEYPDVGNLEQERSKLKAVYSKQGTDNKEAIAHNNKVSAHNAKVEALTEQKDDFIIRQKELESTIVKVAEKQTDLNILKKAFSPTGIVAFKLENLTKDLEDAINLYLAELSEGQFQVEFSLEKEKLNISIIDAGVKSPIETVSGGEFSRIQTAILLAIRSLLSKLGGNGINLLFLDEITGVLDDKGKEELIEVLRNSDLNVFLISHDFSHPLVPKINILKEDKISYIAN